MRYAALTLAAALAVLPLSASAWQTIIPSASGAADESCVGKYAFTGAAVGLKAGPNMVCTLRFPVSDSPMSQSGSMLSAAHVNASIVDNGPGARVMIRIMQRSFATNETTVAATMDSDIRPASKRWQYRKTYCTGTLYFEQFAYWVEVDLIRSDKGGKPAIGPMRIQWSQCDIEFWPPTP